MVEPVPVEDPADECLADYRYLTDAALRRATEDPVTGHGVFIVEGVLAIRRLLESRYRLRSLLLNASRFAELQEDLAATTAPVYVTSRDVMETVTGFDVHRGALAAAERQPLPSVESLLAASHRIAVLEGLNDHENLGVIFRNAAALGVDAALLCPRCADPLYRRTVRVSMGHVLHVPFTRAEPWSTALDRLRHAGFTVAALTPRPEAIPIDETGLAHAPRVALLLGSEGPGLADDTLAAADVLVRIPMTPGVDSLNVASAAAIAFHVTRPARPARATRPTGPG